MAIERLGCQRQPRHHRPPADCAGRGPHQPRPAIAQLQRRGQQHQTILHIAGQSRIALGDAEGGAQHVADLQPFYMFDRGELPINLQPLQPRLAPQDRETLPAFQNIDDLPGAQDFNAVKSNVAVRGLPPQRQRAQLGELFRAGHLLGIVNIGCNGVAIDPHLFVKARQIRARTSGRLGGSRRDPARRGAE